MYVCPQAFIYIALCMLVCAYAGVNVYTYMCMHVCVCVCVCVYVRAFNVGCACAAFVMCMRVLCDEGVYSVECVTCMTSQSKTVIQAIAFNTSGCNSGDIRIYYTCIDQIGSGAPCTFPSLSRPHPSLS